MKEVCGEERDPALDRESAATFIGIAFYLTIGGTIRIIIIISTVISSHQLRGVTFHQTGQAVISYPQGPILVLAASSATLSKFPWWDAAKKLYKKAAFR